MKAKAQPAKRPAGKRVKSTARRAAGARAGKASAAKSAGKYRAPRRAAGRPAAVRRGRARPSRRTRRAPVPCVAEAVAGQPIVGSWWAHPRGRAIFAALSELDDSDDVRCFKLVDGKVTFVHRRVWLALACLAGNGVIDAGRATAIQQEHMPTGEHRNLVTPYPDWVPDDVARAAAALTVEVARAQLGAWV